MTTYKIVRFYRDRNDLDEVVAKGLTLEQAQAHCNDPETSSSTCAANTEGIARMWEFGPWFDDYAPEHVSGPLGFEAGPEGDEQ